LDEPWCSNWKEFIADPTLEAIDLNTKYKRGFGAANANKAAKAYSIVGV
jgi:hypothetical protein